MIPDIKVRSQTLVILSDHRNCIKQFQALQKAGFKMVLYMDNFPYSVATSAENFTCKGLGQDLHRDYPPELMFGDAYTPAAVCDRQTPLNTTSVLQKDEGGTFCQRLSPAEHELNIRYMQ